MTTLSTSRVRGFDKKWYVSKTVCGDLSFSYSVRPIAQVKEGWMSIGYSAPNLEEIRKIIAVWENMGPEAAKEYYTTHLNNYHFGYLPKAEARKYAQYGYGEYAKELLREMSEKKKTEGWKKEPKRHRDAYYKGKQKKITQERNVVEGSLDVGDNVVEWQYDIGKHKKTYDIETQLEEAAKERATEMIAQGYTSGELNTVWKGKCELRGWWATK
jgi:hypothetical protein